MPQFFLNKIDLQSLIDEVSAKAENIQKKIDNRKLDERRREEEK